MNTVWSYVDVDVETLKENCRDYNGSATDDAWSVDTSPRVVWTTLAAVKAAVEAEWAAEWKENTEDTDDAGVPCPDLVWVEVAGHAGTELVAVPGEYDGGRVLIIFPMEVKAEEATVDCDECGKTIAEGEIHATEDDVLCADCYAVATEPTPREQAIALAKAQGLNIEHLDDEVK